MNRISRRSADETAEALLEAGRTQPVLHYDVESGLERHHQWLRSEAPLPEWASASAKSLVSVVTKTIVSVVLAGSLGVAAWQVFGGPQPSAANVNLSSAPAELTQAVAPSVSAGTVTAPEAETPLAPRPLPVPDHFVPGDHPVRRTDKRTTRLQRAHKEPASARAASVGAVPRAEPRDATLARVEPSAPAPASPSEDVNAQRATGREVAASTELQPIAAARKAAPELRPPAEVPDDLVEMQQVAKAEQLLERSPERALALVRQGDQRFASGYFQQERAYIAIMALIHLDRVEEARARAASFAKRFPALPYGARIRSALEARAAPKR